MLLKAIVSVRLTKGIDELCLAWFNRGTPEPPRKFFGQSVLFMKIVEENGDPSVELYRIIYMQSASVVSQEAEQTTKAQALRGTMSTHRYTVEDSVNGTRQHSE